MNVYGRRSASSTTEKPERVFSGDGVMNDRVDSEGCRVILGEKRGGFGLGTITRDHYMILTHRPWGQRDERVRRAKGQQRARSALPAARGFGGVPEPRCGRRGSAGHESSVHHTRRLRWLSSLSSWRLMHFCFCSV
jgi:hypothetical protein